MQNSASKGQKKRMPNDIKVFKQDIAVWSLLPHPQQEYRNSKIYISKGSGPKVSHFPCDYVCGYIHKLIFEVKNIYNDYTNNIHI